MLDETLSPTTLLEALDMPALQVDGCGNVSWMNAYMRRWLSSTSLSPHTLASLCGSLGISNPLAQGQKGWFLQQERCEEHQLSWVWHAQDDGGYLLGHFFCARSTLEESKRALQEKEHSLRHERDQAEKSNYSKTAFIANMSHDLRTPLSGIIGFSDILMEHQLAEASAPLVKSIQAAATQLLVLVNEILDYSDLEKSKTLNGQQVYSPLKLCRQIDALIRPAAEKKALSVTVLIAPGVPEEVLGHRLLLHRVLLNLVSNAVKFTHSGGVTLSVEESDGQLMYAVCDTGMGMCTSDVAVVFEPFDRLSSDSVMNRHSGSGLGLYIVRQFIDLMQGEIVVNSSPGNGTSFVVRVPYEPLPASYEENSFNAEALHFDEAPDSQRVLVVEDHLMAQVVAKHLLEEQGYEVEVAGTAAAGIAAFQQGCFACVLLDMGLPDASGLVCVDAMMEYDQASSHCRTPIIAVTAHVDTNEQTMLHEKGVHHVIQKPLTRSFVTQLATKLRLAQESLVVELG